MSANAILVDLWRAGVALRLSANGKDLEVPAGCMTTEQRASVIGNKAALVAYLHEARTTTEQLLAAAMRACDRHGDDAAARLTMRDDCLALPSHLQADLLEHFKATGGSTKGIKA